MSAIYRVSIYCRDCTGEDPQGCFDGGTMMLGDGTRGWSAREFASIEAAKEAGWDEVEDCGPWEFQVFGADGNVEYDSGAA